MLTVEEVAHHWKLQPETIRRLIGAGRIKASRLGRIYRLNWQDVWACERGPIPGDKAASRYKAPLLSKDELTAE